MAGRCGIPSNLPEGYHTPSRGRATRRRPTVVSRAAPGPPRGWAAPASTLLRDEERPRRTGRSPRWSAMLTGNTARGKRVGTRHQISKASERVRVHDFRRPAGLSGGLSSDAFAVAPDSSVVPLPAEVYTSDDRKQCFELLLISGFGVRVSGGALAARRAGPAHRRQRALVRPSTGRHPTGVDRVHRDTCRSARVKRGRCYAVS